MSEEKSAAGYKLRETENRINRNKKSSSSVETVKSYDNNTEKELTIKELRKKCTKYDAEMIIAQNTCHEKHAITTRSSKRNFDDSISIDNHAYSFRKVSKSFSNNQHCDQNERTDLGKN